MQLRCIILKHSEKKRKKRREKKLIHDIKNAWIMWNWEWEREPVTTESEQKQREELIEENRRS